MEEEEKWLVQRKMSWINTQLLVMILFVVVNIALFVLIRPIIFKAISFLLVSLVTLVLWNRWRKLVKDLI